MKDSATLPGINNKHVIELSEKIRETWNSYFWEYKSCQKHINFGVEERTNYMGDLLNYFDDTVEILAVIPTKSDYQLALYDTVSVLQLMYIQQDLIDELRYVFKMQASNGPNKMLIRTLRNEIIGHPISRGKNGTFISSVFFTRNSCGDEIEYLRYHKDHNYKSKTVHHKWQDLVKAHETYLIENLNQIIQSIKDYLSKYKKQLKNFLKTFSLIPFDGLVSKTEHLFETFYSNSNLYSPENLLYFYQNQNVHARYKFVVEYFIEELKESLTEVINDLNEYTSVSPFIENAKSDDLPIKKIVRVRKIKETKDRSIHYEFSKLYENHPVFGLDHFLTIYKEDAEIFSELIHMNLNRDNKTEYYCSYKFLRHLFQQRGLL